LRFQRRSLARKIIRTMEGGMRKIRLGDVCVELVSVVHHQKQDLLTYLLAMAAHEAEDQQVTIDDFDLDHFRCRQFGVWDWDVENDLVHADAHCADLFGFAPGDAAHGVPLQKYFDAIHPGDLPGLITDIERALRKGGDFEHRFRVGHDADAPWVSARGACTRENARAVRFAGIVVKSLPRHEVKSLPAREPASAQRRRA